MNANITPEESTPAVGESDSVEVEPGTPGLNRSPDDGTGSTMALV